MNIKDFDYLVINTPSDWRQGQATSLAVDDKGQLLLASKASIPLTQKEANTTNAIEPAAIAFDRKNFLYLIEQNSCRLFRYSRNTKDFQQVGCKEIDPCTNQAGDIHSFIETENIKCSRIAFSESALYVLNTQNRSIHSFYYPGFQLRFSLDGGGVQSDSYCAEVPITLKNPKEILTDKEGNLYVLDSGKPPQILLINQNGILVKTIEFDPKDSCQPLKPIAMAIAPNGCLYVLDAGKNSALNSIQKWDKNQNKWVKVADFLACDTQLQPLCIAVDKHNIISVGGNAKYILQFTESEKYLGSTEVEGNCHQLTTDHNGELYGLCGDEKQVFHFGGGNAQFVAKFATKGSYRSKILDSKTFQCQWHRLFLDITIPKKTQFQVYYFAWDDAKINPEEITSEKWQSFINSSNDTIKDALFENAIGQYLVLKFEFSSDGQDSPRVKMAQVYFQRDSYLRFLPAVYQEDSRGKDFLERFLSLYESMSLEVEEKITHITKYFDFDASEKEFLDWLSTWLAVMVDENWPESKKRTLLKEAFELYKSRGTQKTLRRVIEIFTGSEVVIDGEVVIRGDVAIIEHWRLRPPMVLHLSSIVGVSSFVGPKRTQRLILEESSRIGEFVLEENEDAPEKPFAKDAYDFTVLVDTSALGDGDYLKALNRLIEDEKPAHTRYFLRTTQGAVAQLGKQSLLGVNTVLGDGLKPMRIGENAKIGETTLVGTQYPIKGTIGARSRVAVDAILH